MPGWSNCCLLIDVETIALGVNCGFLGVAICGEFLDQSFLHYDNLDLFYDDYLPPLVC